ncbi:MAG TPA: hypothetical protein VFV46_11160 [Lacibacter sp.]|nr:hypothetical protein [Lacibacter sp.]
MVITARILQSRFGIDEQIANYFANERAVPANNRFWGTKRVYISAGFGFLTIPLGFDLMYKSGIPKEKLLDDAHVSLMEQGFDRLKRFEAGEYSLEQFVNSCKELLESKIKQPKLAADLFEFVSGRPTKFFDFETKHKALARSDSFLFTLVDLDLSDEWVKTFLPYWYSLARPILLLDDFKDLIEDRRMNEENTIIELGNNADAIQKAYELGVSDLQLLSQVNKKLAADMKQFLDDALTYEHISRELN